MRLAKKVLLALTILTLCFGAIAQTPRSEDDDRNIAPTVGTGGPVGGPTGLFTVYDGQTLRKGEYTFSAAYSNFARDPGNASFSEVPVSFQVGVSDNLEFFFNTDAYRAIKVNSPRNLSSFYLPNSQLRIGNALVNGPAIVLAPQGPGASQFANFSIFRPQGNQPFAQFPFVGSSAGSFGFPTTGSSTAGPLFGFGVGNPLLGPPRAGGNGADLFPGIGSPYGGILPGVVLQVVTLPVGTLGGAGNTAPSVFAVAPSYLPDAPFINRTYGEASFSTFTVGAKWRWTGPNNPIGVGIIPFYRFYADTASDAGGFNQLQRGASPGGNRGDIGMVLFADARVRKWMNISGNVGYIYNSSVKGEFPTGTFTLLDRPDELQGALALDFPVNRYFQPIVEFRSNQYVGGRTPNAFENSPMDALAGFRWFPTRWMSLGLAYRYHLNQQDRDSLADESFNSTVTIGGRTGAAPIVQTVVSQGIPFGFQTSSDPHGFMIQGTIGRRNKRGTPAVINTPANVTDVQVSDTEVILPCPPGTVSRNNSCNDDANLSVRTSTEDKENDTLVYNYTVSAGRIVGSGANVSWDLSGVRPGTYTITAGVDDGCGVCGKTQTKTITVKECGDCYKPCECPTVSVSGPSGTVPRGELATFTANVSGGTGSNYTYNWTVSNGEIVSGQGTPTITVRGADCTDATATVEIGGDVCPDGGCATTKSDSANWECVVKKESRKVDEFGPAENDDIKARLQNFYPELQSDPTAQGYVIVYGSPREAAKRETAIKKAIDFLRFDPSRFVFVRGGSATPDGSKAYTELWIVPAGADAPQPR
jgi:hypothetical protein